MSRAGQKALPSSESFPRRCDPFGALGPARTPSATRPLASATDQECRGSGASRSGARGQFGTHWQAGKPAAVRRAVTMTVAANSCAAASDSDATAPRWPGGPARHSPPPSSFQKFLGLICYSDRQLRPVQSPSKSTLKFNTRNKSLGRRPSRSVGPNFTKKKNEIPDICICFVLGIRPGPNIIASTY